MANELSFVYLNMSFSLQTFRDWSDINAVQINCIYRVRQNYGIQGLMKRYKFNPLSAINLTRG